MYYHALLRTHDSEYCEYNIPEENFVFNLRDPVESGGVVVVKGFRVDLSDVKRLLVKSTVDLHDDSFSNDSYQQIFETNRFATEVPLRLLERPSSQPKIAQSSNRVFIVHGHNQVKVHEVARFLDTKGYSSVILHEQPNRGMTIIEKIESHSDVGFAIILYSPCDKGAIQNADDLKPRARQNVVFEHGYFVAKLGRERVCALYCDGVELPSDNAGVVYIPFWDNWQMKLLEELKAARMDLSH